MKKISGNKLLVKALKEEGVDILFGYPGACTIDISDEIYKQDYTKVVLPRHEQALVHAADAYARSTGKVGVCLVTSGPGATNLVTGIATANYDSVPLVCFTGQVARHLIGNDAFQEVDIVGITRSITKYGVTVRKREDLGRIIKEAFYIARSGRPGPVLVDLPKDVMAELGSPNYPETVNIRGYKPSTGVHIGQLKRAVEDAWKGKKTVVPGRWWCKYCRMRMKRLPNLVRTYPDSGCDNGHGTWCDLRHNASAFYRKSWGCTVHMHAIWQWNECDLLFLDRDQI